MKAILLAAGKGRRIARMIENIPKSTLPVGHVPLLKRSVEILLEKGMQVSVCVGYQKQHIFDILKGCQVRFYDNPFYEITNSIASLWFAKEELAGEEDIFIINADVFFSEELLDIAIEDENDSIMLVDHTRTKSGDYFFQLQDGNIKKYGKDLPLQERTCEYVGIARLKAPFVKGFLQKLEELVDMGKSSLWWENVIYSMTEEKNIKALDVGGRFWAEIDYFDDYMRILDYIDKSEEQADS